MTVAIDGSRRPWLRDGFAKSVAGDCLGVVGCDWTQTRGPLGPLGHTLGEKITTDGVWSVMEVSNHEHPSTGLKGVFGPALAEDMRLGTIGYWYWGRPNMNKLHVDLRAPHQKVRPDFDLGAPGLRQACDRGDREVFLVDTLDPPIRFTEGGTVGIKRGGL